jgi:transcriptional regulator with GAF, ATPase, and Fis domain
MADAVDMARKAAASTATVLLLGESGTGKEIFARAIHHWSERRSQPFVAINCVGLSKELLESELFGHEKGAFTGATTAKPGLFEIADGGTLFIDEIGELPLILQPKLLRVLEDGWMRRVGSPRERRVNVRVLSATNRDLAADVKSGRFREDLYFRINVMSIELPPLRERPGDARLLVDHFLGAGWEVEPEAREALERYRWPGNVRELRNTLERASVLAEGQTITLDDLPAEIAEAAGAAVPPPDAPTDGGPPSRLGKSGQSAVSLDAIERAHVLRVLTENKGNKARAARALGIHRRKLYRLLVRLGIGDQT